MKHLNYRSVITAAHCLCTFADDKADETDSLCKFNKDDGSPSNQHDPCNDVQCRKHDIEYLFTANAGKGIPVQDNDFNEISLRIGNHDFTKAKPVQIQSAFVMVTNKDTEGRPVTGLSYDIGLIISRRPMGPDLRYPNIGSICLPTRF